MFGYLILISMEVYALVSIEKTYQTLKTVFDHISKYLEVRQKYSATRRIFNSLLGVWKCGQTRSFLFDIFLCQSDKLKQVLSHPHLIVL